MNTDLFHKITKFIDQNRYVVLSLLMFAAIALCCIEHGICQEARYFLNVC